MMRMGIAVAILTLTASCDRSPPPLEHANSDFTTTVEGQEVVLTYEGTHDVIQDEDPDIRLLVLVHHDGRLNSVGSFNYVMAALDSAAVDRPELRLPETTMVLSPGMITDWHMIENPGRYADGHYAWWGAWWRGGANSVILPTVSNFELIDALILHVADRFPSLRAVVQVGHSAGGQLVSRYAVGSTVHDQLRERGIYMRSIIANPSSFLYLDRQRPNLAAEGGFIDFDEGVPVVAEEPCPTFNNYLYGTDGLVPYMGRRPIADMLAAFRTRDIWILNGMEDNEVSPDMDTSCPASLQGGNRLERGRRYYEYLGHFFGPDVYESKFIELVPEVGHDGRGMYTSDQGRAIIFIDADSAAEALSDGGQAQVSQAGIFQAIGSSDPSDRVSAIRVTRQMGPKNASPALRAALIAGLERELSPEGGWYMETAADMANLVSEFKDPRSIPALVDALGTGSSMRGLAALGDPAAAVNLGSPSGTGSGRA